MLFIFMSPSEKPSFLFVVVLIESPSIDSTFLFLLIKFFFKDSDIVVFPDPLNPVNHNTVATADFIPQKPFHYF